MNFWMKNWGVKKEKIIIFLQTQHKRWQCFLHRYISMITTIKVFTCSYIKKVSIYAFLIKLLATTKQLIRRNSTCCLKDQAFFHRVSIEIGLTPPLPLFVSFVPPSPPFHNKPFIEKDSLEWRLNDNASAFVDLNIKANK